MIKLHFKDGREPVELEWSEDETEPYLFAENNYVDTRSWTVYEGIETNITAQCSHIEFKNGVFRWKE